MLEIKTIDMSTKLDQIRKKHGPRYFFAEDASAEAAELWGFQVYNDCGVVPSQVEKIVHLDSCQAEVRLAESVKGFWLMSISAHTSISGISSCPNVFDSVGFDSREDAINAGAEEIKAFYQRELSTRPGANSSSHQIAIKKAIKLIDQSQNQPLLDLFSPQPSGASHGR